MRGKQPLYTKTRRTFFCRKRVMGIVARPPKKPDLAQHYQVNTKWGLPKKSWMVPEYSKTAQKIVAKAKGCPLRGKAIDRGNGKMEAMLGFVGLSTKKGGTPFLFFNRHTGFRCQHRLPRRQPKRGTCGKARRHTWDKTPHATMANNKPKSPSGSSSCIWSKWTRTWP